ncbi:hypothetical protein CONLIGDRAFT_684108 [Coniochaeta ligniaria NRRL 30616]|uniref:Uncharacterized protein n=1 Tax=Coniochaeta ligniaria NRRL 30616 TaxID=1408157 RepID=A0A1J7IWU5_9PEZI|nr:hypothetical protein CONLIGDRAFT_684108 [Coniochaeta ligniaria NRRL 30616]
MVGKKKIKFKCTIQSVYSKEPRHEGLDLVEDSSLLLDVFIARIQREYEVLGEITVWRSKIDGTTSTLIRGQEIKDLRLILIENETIFVIYDEKVDVIPGGVATGANGKGLAAGGIGTGGRVTKDGDKIGGDGVGGNLIGKDAVGEGGRGQGGQVHDGEAGGGAGGKVVKRDPKTWPAQQKKQKPSR